MASQLQPPALLNVFVFNPSLGSEDTESRKLLYFYPPSTPMNAQKDFVGIIEGLHSFTSELSPGRCVHCIRSDEQLYGVVEPEPGWFLAMSVQHPAMVTKLKGGERRVEYREDDIDEHAIPDLLRALYGAFRLFNDTFAAQVQRHPVDVLRARLDLFMRFYLPTLPIAALHSAAFLTGFAFLPVDKVTFLTIAFLVNHVLCSFPAVSHVSVVMDGKLIYTTVEGDDMAALYALTDDHHSFYSLLAINEELSMRVNEAAGGEKASAAPPAAVAGEKAAKGGEGGRTEVSDGDIFLIPPSLYEVMGVKGYSGSGSTESPVADFLSQAASPTKAKPKMDRARSKRAEGERTMASKGEGSSPVGFLTGPYRSPLPASALPYTTGAWSSLNSPMWTSPLPLTLEDRACVNSPRVYLCNPKAAARTPPQGDGSKESEQQRPQASPAAAATASSDAPQRLVVYQRQSITLCFIVEESAASSSPSTNNRPPLSFYDTLESTIHSTLKKLAQVLSASLTAVPSPASALTAPSPSAASSPAELEYRFLYYNHMNLALKCTWDERALSSDVLRVLREMHDGMKRRKGGGESVVRIKGGGWVVGRRAEQSRREFYVLLDEKVLTLHDVQREMDQLQRQYFYNVALA